MAVGTVSREDSQIAEEATVATEPSKVPVHVAMIMDGNGRWAADRGLPRVEGHRAGVETVRMAVEESRRAGVRYLTLYAFSSENWGRPATEVDALMRFFEYYLGVEAQKLAENGVRLRAIGEVEKLPSAVRAALDKAKAVTAESSSLELVLAVSYGGRDEIISACRGIVRAVQRGELAEADISPASFSRFLYAPDIPDPDLLIRTSEEYRISNFLLWQLAYTEIVVSKKAWPEFSREDFHAAIAEYGRRTRRFGLTDEQLTVQGS